MDTMTEQRVVTPAQVNKVRDYVRAQRNREFVTGTPNLRSKPLRQIAEELELRPDAVRDAMLESGWYQAVQDAESADRSIPEPAKDPRKPATRGKRYGPAGAPTLADKKKQPAFDPHGFDE